MQKSKKNFQIKLKYICKFNFDNIERNLIKNKMEGASENPHENDGQKKSTFNFGELRNDTEFITKSTNLEIVCK